MKIAKGTRGTFLLKVQFAKHISRAFVKTQYQSCICVVLLVFTQFLVALIYMYMLHMLDYH